MASDEQPRVDIFVRHHPSDDQQDYVDILERLPQDVYEFRTTQGVSADQRAVIDALTLPLAQPEIVRIESDNEHHIAIVSDAGAEGERKVSFDGTNVTIQQGEDEPVVLGADLDGISAANFIFSAVQLAISRRQEAERNPDLNNRGGDGTIAE